MKSKDSILLVKRVAEHTGSDILSDNFTAAGLLSKACKDLCKSGFAKSQTAEFLLENSSGRKGLELGAMILAEARDVPPKKAFRMLVQLCDHDNWEVREYAGESLSSLLMRHFNLFESELVSLHKSDSENIRRGVVLAIKYLGKYRGIVSAKKLLRVLGHYMKDDSAYVKRNLGPFAIGDALLLYYPAETLAFLVRFSRAKSAEARWNVASAFTTSVGARVGQAALPILDALSRDPDQCVRETVAKALLNISNRSPSTRNSIRPRLKRMCDQQLVSKRVINRIKAKLK